MRRLVGGLMAVWLVTVIVLGIASVVEARSDIGAQDVRQAQVDQPAGDSGLDGLVVQLAGMAGFAAVIALVVNVGKAAGWIADGQAQNWSAGLNLLLLIGLFVARVFRPDVDVQHIDSQVAGFAQIGTMILSYVIQLIASQRTHDALRGVPILGKSYSLDVERRYLRDAVQ